MRVLLATTCRWAATARLALAFADLRCQVHVVCPLGHPVSRCRKVSRIHPYFALAPVHSIRAAMEVATPDLVIPCDDLARECLHWLYANVQASGGAGQTIRAVIERSLGEPALYSIIASRVALMNLADANGVRVPPTVSTDASTLDNLRLWSSRHGFPLVLKADGTSGGRGVRFADTVDAAADAVRTLSTPPSAAQAMKRAVVNRDGNYLRRFLNQTRATVSAQTFVSGHDANATVACWNGRVLGSISVSVLQTLDDQGPASVVRLIANDEISHAVHRIVSLLRLTGLVGLDFVIEEGTGDAYCIELNPRATQLCHLSLGPGRDLVSAFCSAASGEALPDRPAITSDEVIALFPQEYLRDRKSAFLKEAYHDFPADEPDLVHACLHEGVISRLWSTLSALRLRVRSRCLGHGLPARVD